MVDRLISFNHLFLRVFYFDLWLLLPPLPLLLLGYHSFFRWPYRLGTGVLVVYIALGALLDVARHPQAVAGIAHLGYPDYFVRYIGVLKLLGVAALLLPGWPRLKGWAYAGLFFDTTSALYSAIANGDAPAAWWPAALGIALVLLFYFLYSRRVTHPAVGSGAAPQPRLAPLLGTAPGLAKRRIW